MNALNRNEIKGVLKYTWPLYVIVALIVGLIMSFFFSLAHKIPNYQTLTIFVTGEIKNREALKNDLLEMFKDKELKQVNMLDVDENDAHYYTQLSSNGYNSADILILPKNRLDSLATSAFALELSEEIYSSYQVYEQDGYTYGIQIDKQKVDKYMNLSTQSCYMLLNGKSENIGKYSKSGIEEHDNAIKLVKEWGKNV